MRLDLGCGQNTQDGYEGVDSALIPGVTWRVNLVSGERWPWEDSSVDGIHCSHFIEHIQADEIVYGSGYRTKDRLFFFFDECWRILKDQAEMVVIWPSLKSTDAFRDPTHRRFLPLEFLHYLSAPGRAAMKVDHYNVDSNFSVKEALLHHKPGVDADTANRAYFWDVQEAWRVTLVAEKPD